MTRICHISDTHGIFPVLHGEFDFIIHSGDFFPNKKYGFARDTYQEIQFQGNWLVDNIEQFKSWIGQKCFIFCSGNHDYIDPCKILQEFGIDSINITNIVVEYAGLKLYGFPYVYPMNNYQYERQPGEDMQAEIARMLERLENAGALGGLDILVAHSPIGGILDVAKNGGLGNGQMTRALLHHFSKLPKAYLHGHIHESCGISRLNDMIVSNSFMHNHIIEI